MSETNQFEETCGCGHHHEEGEGCGCGHHDDGGCGCEHHDDGDCGCEHHDDGENCGCGHHDDGESCGCGHHHHHHHHHGGGQTQPAQEAPYAVQGQMLGTSVVATSTVTVMAKYAEIEEMTKKELQDLADWVTGQNGSIVQMKSALVAIHSTMMAMTEDGKQMDTVVPEKEEIRLQFVTMANNIPLEELKSRLSAICEKALSAVDQSSEQ